MTIDEDAYVQELRAARQRLHARELLQPGDTLTCRVPGRGVMLLLVEGASDLLRLNLADTLQGPAEMHREVYRHRLDAGAVLIGSQDWAAALPDGGGVLPGVFDEQLRHLGWQVRSSKADALVECLADGANAGVVGRRVLCVGMSLERLVFNAELLEKCAKAYLLAHATGRPVRKIPWLVRWIATGRLRRDQRRAAEAHERGEAPPRSAGY